jgi:hypothetical protein
MEFDAPSQGGGSLKPADVEGHLLVVEAGEYVANIATSFGEKDAIRVTVHDITDGETHSDVLLFGTALIGSLKSQIGKRVLGVMSKGTAKPGQAAPWILEDATGNAKAVKAATAYLTSQTASTIEAPAKSNTSALDAALENLADITA